MKTIKRYIALCVVLACCAAGALMLMFDYDTKTAKWVAITAAVVFFGLGLYLGHLFDRKNLLPE